MNEAMAIKAKPERSEFFIFGTSLPAWHVPERFYFISAFLAYTGDNDRRHHGERRGTAGRPDPRPGFWCRRTQPRPGRQHHGRSSVDCRRRDHRVYANVRGSAPPRYGPHGAKCHADGRKRSHYDALRFFRDGTNDERDRRLRHGGGFRTGVMLRALVI